LLYAQPWVKCLVRPHVRQVRIILPYSAIKVLEKVNITWHNNSVHYPITKTGVDFKSCASLFLDDGAVFIFAYDT
jgi:hypothetical protein